MISKALTFDDVLLVPGYNHIESRKDVSTEARLGPYKFSIPIISANMDTITGVEMAIAMNTYGGLGILHRFCAIDANRRNYGEVVDFIGNPTGVAVSVGVGDKEFERFVTLYKAGARIFCIDVANAHSKLVGRMIKTIREWRNDPLTQLFIIAGNVATYAGADYLVSMGADAVKVGIGAGSVCTTREKTGFGVPQLSAIMDCARVDVPIIADGGMRKPGDVVKALAAGASMVMLGGMLAGTDETPGNTDGFNKKTYRGMASVEAQEDQFGGVADWKTAEGIAIDVKAKGPVGNIIKDVIGGLRSGLTYAGARNIAELHRKANFIEVSNATMIEGTPHASER